MIMSYEQFIDRLNTKIKSDEQLYYNLLETVIKNPHRYTGIFRLSNARTKLIQNVTQSREIKFGDFMEEIITEYINLMGYKNISKNIGTDDNGDQLNADQIFIKDNIVYLIEQKIRDDHDSTKKRGQFENFRKKFILLKKIYPHNIIDATMWFIDDSIIKNKNFYIEQVSKEILYNLKLNILYGKTIFTNLFDRVDVWEEICSYLSKNKQERGSDLLNIPDFDTSAEILCVLKKLKSEKPSLYKKLISDKPQYIQLRSELFPTGYNLGLL